MFSDLDDNWSPYKKEHTEGTKHDKEKPRTDLLPIYPLMEWSKVLTSGAKKYGDHNWRQGIKYSRIYAAVLRHLFAFWAGEDNDQETGLSHLTHALCEIGFLLEFTKRPDLDDRYKEIK